MVGGFVFDLGLLELLLLLLLLLFIASKIEIIVI
jgi:hypothetical protein